MQNKLIKHYLILTALLFFIPFFISAVPQYKGFVTDNANVINENDRLIITAVAEEVKKKSGAEIAVLTVETIEPYGSIEEFSIETAENWGIGEQGKDNGILFVLSTNERYLRIEVGYGLEGAITDGLAGSIIDRYMIPFFKENNFSEGFKNGVLAASSLIAEEYKFEIEGSEYRSAVSELQNTRSSRGGSFGFELILILFFLLGGGRFFWPLLFLSGMSGRRTYRGGFGSGFGGSSGGFSGGFGGFGGGSFGGGGASRSF